LHGRSLDPRAAARVNALACYEINTGAKDELYVLLQADEGNQGETLLSLKIDEESKYSSRGIDSLKFVKRN